MVIFCDIRVRLFLIGGLHHTVYAQHNGHTCRGVPRQVQGLTIRFEVGPQTG